ncbi:MAG: DUF6495 family protein [Lutibacter sp.]|nr:DUF6495 family protein [Lutibacter sp.]
MKYRELTREQFLALNKEFAIFLASQQIDVKEWEKIKKEKPLIAEEELGIFSDVVWEDVLSKTEYLEHISENHINLFKCEADNIVRIYIKLKNKNKSFLKTEDFQWFLKNPLAEDFEYFKAKKKYTKPRNIELFELIEMGSQISKGALFTSINQLIG